MCLLCGCTSQAEIDAALAATPEEVKRDIVASQSNIRRFALAQRATMTDLTFVDPEQPGVTLGHKHIPIQRVGCYIPGGRFPIIASACMQVEYVINSATRERLEIRIFNRTVIQVVYLQIVPADRFSGR